MGTVGVASDLRVRDQVRQMLALVAFTAAASGTCALAFLALGMLGR